MGAKTNHVKIGVFVLLAIGLLIGGLLAFGARSYFTEKIRLETGIAGEVSGLSVGSVVQFRGVPIGRVTRITFAWSEHPGSKTGFIIVDFEVERELLPLPVGMGPAEAVKFGTEKGLRAMVKGQGITGTSLLALEMISPPPPPPELDYVPKHLYIPSAPAQFTRMLDSIEKTLEHLESLDLAGIGQGVTNTLGGVRELADKLRNLELQAIVTNANGLVGDARSAVVKVEDTLGQVQETLRNMKLDRLGQNADALVINLRDTSDRLQGLLAKLDNLPLQDTVGDLRQDLRTLDELLLEMKRYPSGFFFGNPPSPAKAIQPGRNSK